jgi:hydrogenase expression/formation protein HypE
LNNTDKILLGHGSGGRLSHELVRNLFVRHFSNPVLREQTDSALVEVDPGLIAFTTDSFVVDPIFFPGGNIGKLAVCGTVNDISVSGAKPLYLSVSFIIEEGFPLDQLEIIVASMAEEAVQAGVLIVTGDTKVVNRGKCDKIFITTTGIGILDRKHQNISAGKDIIPGDKVIINGSIGDHGMAILAARQELNIQSDIPSDCACLNSLIHEALYASDEIRFMRDPTRGGLATVLSELVENKPYGIMIDESRIIVNEKVRGFCELLGFDPLYVANEGKVLMIVSARDAENVLQVMLRHDLGKGSVIIGEIVADHPGRGWINTGIGGRRIIDMLSGEQLPRIC